MMSDLDLIRTGAVIISEPNASIRAKAGRSIGEEAIWLRFSSDSMIWRNKSAGCRLGTSNSFGGA
jgi:hypothetical protein